MTRAFRGEALIPLSLQVKVPEGQDGYYRIQRIPRIPSIPPHTALFRGPVYECIASDSPGDLAAYIEATDRMRQPEVGSVLILGLGLGIVVQAALMNPDVREVVAVEQAPEVVRLVGPVYSSDPRFRAIVADALLWEPPTGGCFDAIWADIWCQVSPQMLREARALKARYEAHLHQHWFGFWNEGPAELIFGREA